MKNAIPLSVVLYGFSGTVAAQKLINYESEINGKDIV
ncbi:hypothetical protein ACVWYN_001185 [Pedobacter sp. UYP24]